jgi:hypothetical protein
VKSDVFSSRSSICSDLPALWQRNNGDDAFGFLPLFYGCMQCKALIRPKAGDCCFFCSYGSTKCPPIQAQGECCQQLI